MGAIFCAPCLAARVQNAPAVPPVADEGKMDKVYRFHHVDGMYSYITDTEDNVYHFAAWTDVEVV